MTATGVKQSKVLTFILFNVTRVQWKNTSGRKDGRQG